MLVFAFGFLISYAFKDNFFGDLISRCCMAALIGGLADWFGITAIFKKPFNIDFPSFLFRTDIINKNRDRIVDTIVDTIENDLLNKEKIKNRLESYNLAWIIVRFVKSKEGDKAIIQAMDEAFINRDEISQSVSSLIYNFSLNSAKSISVSELLYKFFNWCFHKKYDDILIDRIIESLIKISKKENTTEFIKKLYKESLDSYEKDNINRKITNRLVLNHILDISPKNAAYTIQKELIKILENMKDYDNENRMMLKEKLKDYVFKFHNDIEFINKIENYKIELLVKNSDYLQGKLKNFFHAYATENFYKREDLHKLIKSKKRKVILKLIRDKEKINKFDRIIKDKLFQIIDKKYDYVGKLVRENLNKYNNEEIVKIMEEKLSDDLQIIRINGSIVGGLIGIFIFLLTFWIK